MKRWENNISKWTGLKFCEALRESENKIKWRERANSGLWRPNGHHDYTIGAGTYLFHKWAQPSQADKCIGSY